MKHKLYILLFSMVFIHCASTYKNKSNIEEVIYDAITRGRLENISIINTDIIYKTKQETKKNKLSKTQLKELLSVIKTIDLNNINNLKPPTNNRLFDGAMHTTISIKKNGIMYTSITFDDSNPPKELNLLCKLIKSFVKDDE